MGFDVAFEFLRGDDERKVMLEREFVVSVENEESAILFDYGRTEWREIGHDFDAPSALDNDAGGVLHHRDSGQVIDCALFKYARVFGNVKTDIPLIDIDRLDSNAERAYLQLRKANNES
jgi:hypothetical protein